MGFHGGAWNEGIPGVEEGMSIAMEARGCAKYNERYQYYKNTAATLENNSYFSNNNEAKVDREASLQNWKQRSQPLLDGGQGKNRISGLTSRRTPRAARRVRGSGFCVDGGKGSTGAKGGDVIRVQQRSKVDSSHVDVTPPLKSQGQCVRRAGGPDEPSPGGSAPSSAKGYLPGAGGTVSHQIACQSPSPQHCAGVEEEGDDALSSKGDASVMAATRLPAQKGPQ